MKDFGPAMKDPPIRHLIEIHLSKPPTPGASKEARAACRGDGGGEAQSPERGSEGSDLGGNRGHGRTSASSRKLAPVAHRCSSVFRATLYPHFAPLPPPRLERAQWSLAPRPQPLALSFQRPRKRRAEDPFARLLLSHGISQATLEAWLGNPFVEQWPVADAVGDATASGPLFECTAKADSAGRGCVGASASRARYTV